MNDKMGPKVGLQQLTTLSEEAEEIATGIEEGSIPREWTALKHERQRTDLDRRLQKFTTSSINTYLGNLRKKARLSSSDIIPRVSADQFKERHPIGSQSERRIRDSGANLLVPQFEFVPLHHCYAYATGTIPSRTNVVAEVNLPSGVRPSQFKVLIAPGGEVLELTVVHDKSPRI